jgi:outer membrane cobalamin receptor
MYFDFTEEDHVAATLNLRSARNSFTGKSVPYLPSFQLTGMYQHRFPFPLTSGVSLRAVGRQFTDTDEAQSLAAVVVVDLHAEYAILPQWRVSFAMNNLLGNRQTWWRGYPGVRQIVDLGTSYSW